VVLRTALAAVLGCVLVGSAGSASAAGSWSPTSSGAAAVLPRLAGTENTGPEQQLALRYAPVVRVRTQEEECGPGEPYLPIDVTALLPDSGVAFRGPWSSRDLIKVGPTAEDLRAGWYGYHLDFPGDALSPGCDYEKWERRITGDRPPTVYAHVTTDAQRPGKVALQYWFFYVYNDFNNKHEGDWEMIQLIFPADDAVGALRTDPTEVGYTQHSSAERATWDADKLELVGGTHPVVYPADGSHANFFTSALHIGYSSQAGLGCDDTAGPHTTLATAVEVVPSQRSAYLQQFPWLGFQGRWGELQPAFYNGPTGPNMKERWTEPIRWSEQRWRSESASVPLGSTFGPSATGFFCGAVEQGSTLLLRLTRNPLPVVVLLLLVGALLLTLVTRTSWSPAEPLPAERRRASGQIIATSWALYRRRPLTFLAIGAVYLPVMLIAALFEHLLVRSTGLDGLTQNSGNPLVGGVVLALGSLASLAGWFVVLAGVAIAVVELDRVSRVSLPVVVARLAGRWRCLLAVAVALVLAVTVLVIPVVTVPLAVVLVVRNGLGVQAAVLEDGEWRAALRRSRQLTRGHSWRVAVLGTVLIGIVAVLGPLAGVAVLLGLQASVTVANLVSGFVYAVTVPFVALCLTYLFLDLRVRVGSAGDDAGVDNDAPWREAGPEGATDALDPIIG
jgi:hypothetical protein